MQRLLAVCVVIGAAMVVGSSGAAVKPQTLNLIEVSTSFAGAGGFDEHGNSPPKIGQGFVGTSTFYKWKGTKRGARFGALNVACTFMTDPTSDSAKTLCTAVATFRTGTLTATGLIGDGASFEIPIVGGTGAYAGAKGYVRVKQIGGENSDNSADTFVITG
jgi:hypothetical protein